MICASKYTENYCEEENNLSFEKLFCFFIHIFWKSLCNLPVFYRLLCRCEVLRPFVYYLFEVQCTVLVAIFFFAGGKCVDLVVIFNQRRKETSAVSLQNGGSCVCIKYLILVWPRKLIAINFTFLLYSIKNVHNSSIAKKLSSSQFFEQIKLRVYLFLFQKKNSPQNMFMSCLCLRHGAYLNGISNMFTHLLIIFLGRDWFGFFLNKWGCIRFTV